MYNVFAQAEFLEPKCPGCNSRLDYGVTTSFKDTIQAHVCNKCGCSI